MKKYNLIQYSYNDYKITNKKDVLVKEFKSRQSALNWLNKQMSEVNKIISNFKKGVADGLFKGKEDNPNNLAYYRQGYDYGISLYCTLNEDEVE